MSAKPGHLYDYAGIGFKNKECKLYYLSYWAPAVGIRSQSSTMSKWIQA